MTNFIFKSQATYKKLANTLEVILNEQRHQRSDLQAANYKLDKLIKFMFTTQSLEKDVEEFHEDLDKHLPLEDMSRDLD